MDDRSHAKSCAWVEERLISLLEGELPAAEQQAIEEHTRNCPACAEKLRTLQAVQARLSLEAAQSAPVLSSQARQRIREQVQPKLRTATMYQGLQKFARGTFSLLSIAAVLVLIALAIGWIMRLLPQQGAQPTPSLSPTGLPSPTPTGILAAIPDSTATPSPAGSQPVKLIFAVLDPQVETFQKLAEQFQAQHPQITIEVVPVEKLIANDYDNASQRLANGADAALYLINPMGVSRGWYLNLDPYLQATPDFQADDYYPNALDAYRWQDGLWGLPAEIQVDLILYDRSLLEKAGLPDPAVDWDQASFLKTAQALTGMADGTQRYGFVDFTQELLNTTLYQGLEQLQSQGRFDMSSVAAGLKWYSDLAEVYKVMPAADSSDALWKLNQELVNNGSAGMWTDGLYNYIYHQKTGDRNLGLALIPTGAGPVAPASSYAYLISGSSPHPQEAWQWLAFLSRQNVTSGLPDATVGLPPRRSVAESSNYWQQFDAQTLAVMRLASERLTFASFNPGGVYYHLWTALRAMHNGANVTDALAEAQKAYNDELAAAPSATATPIPAITRSAPSTGAARILFWNGNLTNDLLYQSIEKFQASHPDIQVDVLQRWENDTQLPDCFASYPTVLHTQTIDLQPLLDADPAFKAQFNPAVLKYFQSKAPQGQLLSLPAQATPLMIHYNKDMFDAAGVAYPSPDWTMDDFLAAAKALTRQGPHGIDYGYVSQQSENEDLAVFAAAMGAPFWDANGQPLFDTPEAQRAVQWYTDLALKYKVTPPFQPAKPGTPGPGSYESNMELIRSGRAAMWSEFYPYNGMLGATPGSVARLGWAPWPRGVQRATDVFYDGYSIDANSSQVQACWQWISYLTGVPEAAQGIPARLDVQNSPAYLTSGMGPTAEDLPLQKAILNDYVNAYDFHHQEIGYRPLLDDLLAEIFKGMPLTEALAKIQHQALNEPTPTPVR